MERLPDEVLLLILRLLPAMELLRAARVCPRWAALVGREALQLREAGQAAAVGPGLSVLLVTAPRLPLLQSLLRARNLRHLTVHAGAPLSERDFAALQCLPFLAHLDVFAASRLLRANAAPALRRLRALVLNDLPAPGLLRALADDDAPLRELHMYGRAFYYVPRELTALLAVRRLHLRELTLRCAELRTSAYEAIGACRNLSALRLYACWMLTAEGAEHVARPRRLRALHVTGARMLRSRAMTQLLLALPPDVHELVLSATWFGDEHAALLAERLPRLQLLELWRCRLSPAGAERLALALPELRDFDCDLRLSPEQVRSLCAHPALQNLRAALPPGECSPSRRPAPAIRSATSRCGRRWVRGVGGGEGYRADLFYSWSRDLRLPTATARFPPPLFDSDDDDDAGDVTRLAFTAPAPLGHC